MNDNTIAGPPPDLVLVVFFIIGFVGFSVFLELRRYVKEPLKQGKEKWLNEIMKFHPLARYLSWFKKTIPFWVELCDWALFWGFLLGFVITLSLMMLYLHKSDTPKFYRCFCLLGFFLFSFLALILKEVEGLPYIKYKAFTKHWHLFC